MSAKSLADNGWVTLFVRGFVTVASTVILLLAFNMNAEIARQGEAINGLSSDVAALEADARDYFKLPIYDANQAQAMDLAHRKVMDKLDARIRVLEAGGGWQE